MDLSVNLTQRHGAEADPVVAAASILARGAFLEGLESLSHLSGLKLPKGASRQVIQAGKALVSKKGESFLKTVAKLHFKTVHSIIEVGTN